MARTNNTETQVAVLSSQMEGLTDEIKQLREQLAVSSATFVRQSELTLQLKVIGDRLDKLEKVVYAGLGFIVLGVGGTLILNWYGA